MANIIVTLHDTEADGSVGENNLLPRTRINALFDGSGSFISDDVTAEDLNSLHDVVVGFNALGLSIVNGELNITYTE